MTKNIMALILLIAFGLHGQILGLFTYSKPIRDKDLELAYGREEGVEHGREQVFLGAAAAYAGYKGLNWAYNRWFRKGEVHVLDLFNVIKKNINKIQIETAKLSAKPIESKDNKDTRDEFIKKANEACNLIEIIIDLYKKDTIGSQYLLQLKNVVVSEAEKKVKMITKGNNNTNLENRSGSVRMITDGKDSTDSGNGSQSLKMISFNNDKSSPKAFYKNPDQDAIPSKLKVATNKSTPSPKGSSFNPNEKGYIDPINANDYSSNKNTDSSQTDGSQDLLQLKNVVSEAGKTVKMITKGNNNTNLGNRRGSVRMITNGKDSTDSGNGSQSLKMLSFNNDKSSPQAFYKNPDQDATIASKLKVATNKSTPSPKGSSFNPNEKGYIDPINANDYSSNKNTDSSQTETYPLTKRQQKNKDKLPERKRRLEEKWNTIKEENKKNPLRYTPYEIMQQNAILKNKPKAKVTPIVKTRNV